MTLLIAGRYRIEKRLSDQGATAEIYLAHDAKQPDTPVVLKCARTTGRDRYAFQDHLRQEVEVLRKLTHPGVIRIHPALDDAVYIARTDALAGMPWYYVMDYLAGGSLSDHLPHLMAHTPLQWRLSLFQQIVETLAYLHEQGVAHGDLKPDHLMFRAAPTPDQHPQPILIDFGAASPIDAPSINLAVSLLYAAPELLRTLDDSSVRPMPAPLDVWALGAILFETATGMRLITGTNRRSIVKQVTQGSLYPEQAQLSAPFQQLLNAMLQPDPRDRPTVSNIRDALRTLL